jgi:hypothetical protein
MTLQLAVATAMLRLALVTMTCACGTPLGQQHSLCHVVPTHVGGAQLACAKRGGDPSRSTQLMRLHLPTSVLWPPGRHRYSCTAATCCC